MNEVAIPKDDLTTNENEIHLGELLKTVVKYKWSIVLITLLTLLASAYILYFKTPLYLSEALIEVKSSTKNGVQGDDFLGNTFTNYGQENVDKEIEILKTFDMHNHALNNVYFQVQYYVDQGYKKIEIYNDVPIKIIDLKILNDKIIGKRLIFTPVKDGYQLEVKNSFSTSLKHTIFGKEILKLESKETYQYGHMIKTPYFTFKINKESDIPYKKIYFTLQGENRQIYDALSNNIQISQASEFAPLIKISYKDSISKRSTAYVDALIESFIEQSILEKSKSNNRIIQFINSQLADIKVKLDHSEDELEKYRIVNSAIQPTLQGQTYIQELTKLEVELSQNALKEKLIQGLISFSKNNRNLAAMAPSLMDLNDQPTLNLIEKLQEAQINEEGLRSQYSDKHPELIAVRKQIRYIKQKIVLNIKNLKSSMKHRNENLHKLKIFYNKKLETIPTHERKLINLKRDYEVSSKIYNYLLQKKSENEMTKVAILSNYRIVDPAYTSDKPIGPKASFIFIIGLLLGLFLGIVQALLRNVLNTKIQSKDDIHNLTTLPVYGVLPLMKQKVVKLEVFKNPKSPFTESYRSLRTNLQFMKKENQASVILITSTIMGEGKSSTSANLASIFQMANYKSIVINLDMRKPTLHHYFDVDNTIGMSTYLSGKNNIQDIIHPTMYEHLDIITSGPIPPNPSELLLGDRLNQLIDSLKESYDYIFIDSAPLGLVTDTMHIMKFADISLIVFREKYSEKSFITDLNTLIKRHNLNHIGLIINAVDISSESYGYGYGE